MYIFTENEKILVTVIYGGDYACLLWSIMGDGMDLIPG